MNQMLKIFRLKTFILPIVLLMHGLVARGQIKGGTVVAWGDNSYGQTNVPAGLTNVVQIVARDTQCLALNADGTVVAWGNSDGVSNVPITLTNVVWIAAGQNFDVALGSDGTEGGWGNNFMGQCGTNVVPDAVEIAAGYDTTLVLKSDGTFWGAGDNEAGQLNAPLGITNLVALAGGWIGTYSLTSDGNIVSWGWNVGTQYMPSTVYGNMIAISGNWSTVVAVTGAGTVVNGPAGLSNIVAVAAGNPYSLALQSDGTVVEWGNTLLPAGLSNVVAVAAGAAGGLAIVSDGSPQFVRQPFTQTPYAGTDFSLNANAVGAPPLSYQWYLGGNAIPGQTNGVLTLSNVQPSADGYYSVAVSNAIGSITSTNVSVTVNVGLPIITSQSPADQLALLGTNITLAATATGPEPMTYQWQFAGTNIAGATNLSLSVTNFQVPNEGYYTLLVSNPFAWTNATMHLTAGDLAGALNNRQLVWSGAWTWESDAAAGLTHDGIAAARSAAVGNGRSSGLSTSVTGPGTLTFWYMIYSGVDDIMTFSVDGTTEAAAYSGGPWTQIITYLPAGSHNLDWVYTRNTTTLYVFEAGYLDQVTYSNGPTLPILTTTPTNESVSATGSATFNVAATGTPPISYQWQFSGTNIPNATNTSLSLTGVQAPNAGSYSAVVSNPYGTNVATAVLTVVPVPPTITSEPVNQRVPPNGVAAFSVGVTGSTPFSYQWQLNGTNIDGGTNSSLTISNVQQANTGNYQVTISNGDGTTNSSIVVLTVAQLLAWGYNNFGEINIPPTLTNAAAIAAGLAHSMALNFDSTVTVWGYGFYGQTNVPAGLSNVVAISAGFDHCLALKNDGSVVAWGAGTNVSSRPNFGQCIVPAGLTNVAAIAAGGYHSLILESNGTVVAWGDGSNGVINYSSDSFGQANVPPGLSNIVAVAAGGYHSLALRSDGMVIAWGDGTNNTSPPPGSYGQAKIPANLSNVVAIAAGVYHSLALKGDGTVVAWGNNQFGQTNIPVGLSNVVAIACGANDSMAVTSAGSLVIWGRNDFGQATVPVGVTNVVGIAGGGDDSMCIMNDGSPVIARQSLPQTVYAGSGDTMSVTPISAGPLGFQWLFDGTNIDGATNAVLNLVQIPTTSGGNYQCIVSNAIGSITSAPVTLAVLRTIPQFVVSSNSLQLTSTGLNLTLGNLSGHGPSIIYASTDLLNWQPILTNPATVGATQIFDPSATNFPSQFYRAIEQ